MPSGATEHRQLVAIMFTDMVGYSTLAERSEAFGLALLEEHRKILRSVFPRFNGVEVKTIGDGFLVEFNSALEAVECAIEIQRALAKRNTDVPVNERIDVRIGIHIGDVIHRDGDVLGEGVNIAARIQSLASPGGICVSVDVERQIRNKVSGRLVPIGPAALKNIQAPIDLFRVALPWERDVPPPGRTSGKELHRLGLIGLVLFVSLLAAGVIWQLFFVRHNRADSNSTSKQPLQHSFSVPITPAQKDDTKSVAVLPFVDMSADKSDEYFGDGITEELINALAQVHNLRVPARTSSFAFKGKNEDIRKIGQQLGVSAVLEGSVRRAGTKLRITAQLINLADGYHLWSQTYDREMSDIFAIQSEVARRVVESLKVTLFSSERARLGQTGTLNEQAYELALRARSFWNKRTAPDLKKAIDYYNRAIEQDTNYAQAYVGLASCYKILPEYGMLAASTSFSNAEWFASRALELDAGISEAHAVLGGIKAQSHWDWMGAEAEFKRAIALNANSAVAHQWYAFVLRLLCRFDEALAQIKIAQQLDPLSPLFRSNEASVLCRRGNYDEAFRLALELIDVHPEFPPIHNALGETFVRKRMFAEAIAEFQKARRPAGNGPYQLGAIGHAHALSGNRDEAQKILQELDGWFKEGYAVAHAVACVHLALGNRDEALTWIEKATEQNEHGSLEIKCNPDWDPIRSHPRFRAILKKMRLET